MMQYFGYLNPQFLHGFQKRILGVRLPEVTRLSPNKDLCIIFILCIDIHTTVPTNQQGSSVRCCFRMWRREGQCKLNPNESFPTFINVRLYFNVLLTSEHDATSVFYPFKFRDKNNVRKLPPNKNILSISWRVLPSDDKHASRPQWSQSQLQSGENEKQGSSLTPWVFQAMAANI